MFPIEIASATSAEAPLVTLLTNAPSVIAGQYLGPNSSSAASAMPVGGQTGVITPCATDSARPSFAPPMYAAAMPTKMSTCRRPMPTARLLERLLSLW